MMKLPLLVITYSRKSIYFLASLNFTIFLLSITSLLIITKVLSNESIIAGKWIGFITSLNLFYSKILIVLLCLFSINLLTCCLNRLPKTFKIYSKSSIKILDESFLASAPLVERFRVKDCKTASEPLCSIIKAHFKKTFIKQAKGHIDLYAEKGKYTHVGFYIVHLSILIIIIGGMLATKGYEYLFEIKKNQVLDPFEIRDSKGKKELLGFSIVCEDINSTLYPGTSKIKKIQSKVSVIVKGEKVKTQDVNLAHPLRYGGISIHQEFLRNKIQYAKLKVISKNGESQFCEVKAGDRFKLGNTNITVLANRFKSDAVQLINPYSGTDILVSGNPVGFNDALRDWSFCIEGIFYKEATCLRAVKDPGMNLIWAGTFFMLCGFCIMFLIPHQQIWISLQQSNEWYIIVAGSSTKNLDSFEEIFNKIVLSVKQSLCEDGYAQQRYEKN